MKRPVLTIIVVLGMSLTALAQSRGDDISRLINAFLDEQDPDRVGVSACREVNELQKLVLDLKSAFLEESGQ